MGHLSGFSLRFQQSLFLTEQSMLGKSVSIVHSIQPIVLTRESAVGRVCVSCLQPQQSLSQPYVFRPRLHPQTSAEQWVSAAS